MDDRTIHALRVNSEWSERVFTSLQDGVGRFGWSYIEGADLQRLQEKNKKCGWESLTGDEKECYQSFLLGLKPGDSVVYINVPKWGYCTVAEVSAGYYWEFTDSDFNHRFGVEKNGLITFNRNDSKVHPYLSARLKLQGRQWRIFCHEEFFASLYELRNSKTVSSLRSKETNRQFLSEEIDPLLKAITQKIHKTHPNINLEELFADLFRNIPGVLNVKKLGGPSDHGADLLVTYEEGLPISGLMKQSLMVMQVKSYSGSHNSVQAIDDIKRAFDYYPEATSGLILSTADDISPEIEKKLSDSSRPIVCLYGKDIAKLLIQYGTKML